MHEMLMQAFPKCNMTLVSCTNQKFLNYQLEHKIPSRKISFLQEQYNLRKPRPSNYFCSSNVLQKYFLSPRFPEFISGLRLKLGLCMFLILI